MLYRILGVSPCIDFLKDLKPVMEMKPQSMKVSVMCSLIVFMFYLLYNCCINLLSYVAGFRTLYHLDFFPSVCQLRTMLGGEIKSTT